MVKPGATLSLQKHHRRSEHWVVVSGAAVVTNGEQQVFVRGNESAYISAGVAHRLANPGVIGCVMIEVQSGVQPSSMPATVESATRDGGWPLGLVDTTIPSSACREATVGLRQIEPV